MLRPKLTLVGAGPGDPELITMKGVLALQRAEVVLYDALVNPEILDYTRSDALLIPVGKRAGRHSMRQEQIHDLIVLYAQRYKYIVRLKGGDPFVFGRGKEEELFATAHGITVECVPGISSSMAVPASVGIPVTHRGVNQSFWVMTATQDLDRLGEDIRIASQSSATLVILMGMRRLEAIVSMCLNYMPESMPMALVRNGTRTDAQYTFGSIGDYDPSIFLDKNGGPGIIVIGEVVRLAEEGVIDKKELNGTFLR